MSGFACIVGVGLCDELPKRKSFVIFDRIVEVGKSDFIAGDLKDFYIKFRMCFLNIALYFLSKLMMIDVT